MSCHSSQLAHQQAQTYASGQAKEAEAVADHVTQVQARWFACLPDAEAAIADYEGRGQGRRGRRPRPWRYHVVRYRMVADTRRMRRARRGRPAKTEPPPLESGYRLVVEVEAGQPGGGQWLDGAGDDGQRGGLYGCGGAAGLSGATHQRGTGLRWIKNPAAISPVWLEKPERIAALAMLTVVSLLVYTVIQRQVRLYLRTHAQQLPGNKGETATPTAAVVLALFAQVALVQLWIDEYMVVQIAGVQPHHLLVCDALGLDASWYAVPSAHKIAQFSQSP